MKTFCLFAISGAFCAQLIWQFFPPSHEGKREEQVNLHFEEIDLSQKDSHYANHLLAAHTEQPSENAWAKQKIPFHGIHRAGFFTWTAIDGKKPDVMHYLATDPEMLRRLYLQNEYVLRRQFVFVDPAFHVRTEEILHGLRKEVKLPGFDGEQLAVKVKEVDRNLEGGVSAWSGHLVDSPETLVQMSSIGPEIHIGIHMKDRLVRYESRDIDQWIIQEVDLNALRESQPKASGLLKVLASQ